MTTFSVSLPSVRKNLGEALPGADIVPADVGGNDRDFVRFLGNPIVYRDLFKCREDFAHDGVKARRCRGRRQAPRTLASICRQVSFVQGTQSLHRRDEHAGVPEIAAVAQILLGDFQLRLFFELLDFVHGNPGIGFRPQCLAALNIAEADVRAGRRDAERD